MNLPRVMDFELKAAKIENNGPEEKVNGVSMTYILQVPNQNPYAVPPFLPHLFTVVFVGSN